MAQRIYSAKEVAFMIGCTLSALRKATAVSKTKGICTIKVKQQVFYFQNNADKKGHNFSRTAFEKKDTLIDTKIKLEDLNIVVDIFINGLKVN